MNHQIRAWLCLKGAAMRLCMCKLILLIGAAACGCQNTVPVTPKPGEPGQVRSSPVGLFAPAAAPPICSTRVDAAHVGPQGVFDHNNDGIEAVTLIAELNGPLAQAGVFGLLWLQGNAVIGAGISPVVEVPVGDYVFTLVATVPFGGFEPLCSLNVSVVPPDTPTAVFHPNESSFSNACIDPCAGIVTTLPSDPGGAVLLHLNGSGSSGGLERKITRFSWRVDGIEVAHGPVVTLLLRVGEHEIELLVENDVGLIHRRIMSGVVVRDATFQGGCPQCG